MDITTKTIATEMGKGWDESVRLWVKIICIAGQLSLKESVQSSMAGNSNTDVMMPVV